MAEVAAEAASSEVYEVAKDTAHKATRLYRARALLWTTTAILAVTLILISLDWLIHVEEVGLRWLLFIVWLGSIAAICTYAWQQLRSFKIGPSSVALWIESQRPELAGKLTTLVQLHEMQDADDRFGSMEFRRMAARHNAQLLRATNWQAEIEYGPSIMAAIVAAACAGLFIIALAAFPESARLAFMRMLTPWSALPWPQSDQLELVDLPELIASGSSLNVQVIDRRPPLPGDVVIQWSTSEPASLESTATKGDNDRSIGRIATQVVDGVALATLPEMRSRFWLRAIGGDDQRSRWREVRVAELPRLISGEFHIAPPAYTHLPERTLVGEKIEAIRGSTVVFHGKLSSAVRHLTARSLGSTNSSAQNAPQNKPQADQSSLLADKNRNNTPSPVESTSHNGSAKAVDATGATWEAQLSSDGTEFTLFASSPEEGRLEQDRTWRLEFETVAALHASEPTIWSVRAIPDRPPQVHIASISSSSITREARIEVRGAAVDDLGLARIDLLCKFGGNDSPDPTGTSLSQRINVWQASSQSLPENTNGQASDSADNVLQQVVRYDWSASDHDLSPGQSLQMLLEATDSLGQTSQSLPQLLSIKDSSTMLAELQTEQAEVVRPLRNLLESQERNQQSITRLSEVLSESDKPRQADVDAIASARLLQQSIAQQAASSSNSVLQKLKSLSDRARQNGLSGSNSVERLQQMTAAIESLESQALKPALEDLSDASTALTEAATGGDSASTKKAQESIQRSLRSQADVVNRMKQLVEGSKAHSRWLISLASYNASRPTSKPSNWPHRNCKWTASLDRQAMNVHARNNCVTSE